MEKVFRCEYAADLYDFHMYCVQDYVEFFIPRHFLRVTFPKNGKGKIMVEDAQEPRVKRLPYDSEKIAAQIRYSSDPRNTVVPLLGHIEEEIPQTICDAIKEYSDSRKKLKEKEERCLNELLNL